MWKALIKLVNKWAYRCEHNWIEISSINIKDRLSGHITAKKWKYRCTKCCKFKNTTIDIH